jgi:Fic family protein
MTFIHELSNWPDFTWDDDVLASALADVRHKQGRHLGRMEALGFEFRREASVDALTSDVVKSSAIEGEQLDPEAVRSSIAQKLGVDVAGLRRPGREVEGIVQVTLDATQNHAAPLAAKRLHNWHAALFPTGRSGMFKITVGAWRDDSKGPMQVVSGPVGRQRVHFQAPAAKRLRAEMKKFVAWFNQPPTIDPLLKAAVAHFWLVTIHPFDDGNGRIARAVADMALARADGTADRYYSMSTAIEASKREYYLQLESAQRGSLDITAWLVWFLDCLGRAIDTSEELLDSVLKRAKLWQQINLNPVNDRQRKVINRMLDAGWEGFMTTSKYARLAGCSKDTALRDITDLVERGIMVRNQSGGRSTSYRLAEPDDV